MSKNYEELRAKNIEDNKRILAELGLLNPFNPLPKVRKNKIVRKKKEEEKPARKPSKYYITNEETKPEDLEGYGSTYSEGNSRATRKSSRLRGKKIDFQQIEAVLDQAYEEAEEEMEEARAHRRVLANRPMVYGPIPGVEVGTWWATRMECNHDGIHRPPVMGIHAGPKGAYSIALSGGYEDDVDMGDCFTYTGEGGRDLKGTANNPKNLRTAPQSKDQCLSRGNMALKTSSETGFGIRVIRGYKSESPFAPDEGYRYDGLYKCEKAWYTVGMAGFGVWKFALRRMEDQAPPPWTIDGEEGPKSQEAEEDSEDADTKDDLKEEKVELRDEQAEVKKEADETKDVKTKIQKEKVQERSSEEEPEKPKETEEGKKLKSKATEKKKEIKEESTTEIKEENNNDEGLIKSAEAAIKPMKEVQTTKNEKKKGQKRKKSEDEEFEDDEDEEETKPKKVKKETKKEKKEKENTAMSKGIMGWLIKTP